MATLRRDARALVDAVRASGSRVIKNFDADDDGVCVSMTLERGHTSNLTLIFEVRTPPMAPNHSSFLGLDARILPPHTRPSSPSRSPSHPDIDEQDGYPKGSFVAMSDDDRDDAAVATLNANVADRAPGSLVSLKDAVLSIGTVFGFEGDARKVVDACVDAPDDKDAKGAEGADTAVHASDTSTAGSEDEDLEEDEEAYAYSDDASDDDQTSTSATRLDQTTTQLCPASSTPTSSRACTRTSASAWNGRRGAWRGRPRTRVQGRWRRGT